MMEEKTEGDVISMVDVLEEEKLLQDDANAVLGGSDAEHCTYSKGYIPRQALYACQTCETVDGEMAGICLACSLHCHDGHNLTELYTKRNFCCDCGNSKFINGATMCKLCPEKSSRNADNRYNHNFRGLYCECERPYPDPDDSTDDVMLQCSVCEDWFHGRHMNLKEDDDMPDQDEFEEMTCASCVKRCYFLVVYAKHCPGMMAVHHQTDVAADVDVVASGGDSSTIPVDSPVPGQSQHTSCDTVTRCSDEKDQKTCKFKELPAQTPETSASPSSALFWQSGWRQKLCRCVDCLAMYDELGVSFLTDESDTIAAYEERGKQMAQPGSSYDQGLEVLSSMNRIQQVELVHGFVELKTELKEYLKKFADNGKVVRQEDIQEFFAGLEARKRQRAANGPPQYYCK